MRICNRWIRYIGMCNACTFTSWICVPWVSLRLGKLCLIAVRVAGQVGASLNSTEYEGSGNAAPLGARVEIRGLQPNETYILAVTMLDENGDIINGLGQPTREIPALLPLPLLLCWAYLATTALRLACHQVLCGQPRAPGPDSDSRGKTLIGRRRETGWCEPASRGVPGTFSAHSAIWAMQAHESWMTSLCFRWMSQRWYFRRVNLTKAGCLHATDSDARSVAATRQKSHGSMQRAQTRLFGSRETAPAQASPACCHRTVLRLTCSVLTPACNCFQQ